MYKIPSGGGAAPPGPAPAPRAAPGPAPGPGPDRFHTRTPGTAGTRTSPPALEEWAQKGITREI